MYSVTIILPGGGSAANAATGMNDAARTAASTMLAKRTANDLEEAASAAGPLLEFLSPDNLMASPIVAWPNLYTNTRYRIPSRLLVHLFYIRAKATQNHTGRLTNDYLAELIDALFCELVLGALDLSNTVQFSSFLSERKERCLSRTNPEYSVTDTGIHPRDSKFHKNLSAATSKNKILRKDDLVFGISRKILNWGLFEDEIGEVGSAYRVYSIRSLPPEYVARYIAHYQHAFTDIIKPSSREGQGIMPDALMAKTIPVLDEEAWNRYVRAVESMKEQIRIVADESDALAELRDALLPKLMSGEIDVSTVDLTQHNNQLRVLRYCFQDIRKHLGFSPMECSSPV